MATAEFALVLPVLVLVTAVLVAAVAGASLKLHACEIARNTARAEAIGAAPQNPGRAHVTTGGDHEWVAVNAALSPRSRFLSFVTLECKATALRERGLP